MLTQTDLHPQAIERTKAAILDRVITAPVAWRRNDIAPADWLVPVTSAALAELDTIADAFADHTGALDDIEPSAFDWPAMTEVMVTVRSKLEDGIGFAVLDRLPVERWGRQASTAIAWLLTNFLAPAIKQKWKGARIYDVRDTKATLQYGVRRSITNLEQEFHTDGSFSSLTPEIIGLACLQQAVAGGRSRLVSLATVHNVLLEHYPDELNRLYRPYWWDRQAEHAPDEPRSSWHPIFSWDSRKLRVRYYDDYIRNGYRLMDAALDDDGAAALAAMRAAVEDPENWIDLRLEPGQIEYANNHLVAHGRTAFRDEGGQSEARHLLRFWLRNGGGLELEPNPPVLSRHPVGA